MNTSALDWGRKWNFSCTEPKAKEHTAWAKSIHFSFVSPRYIFGDPGAVIRFGRNRRDESTPFLATRQTATGSTKMHALLTGQANVQFDVSHAYRMEQRSKLGISAIIFAQWNFKGAILRPRSHESGHFWNSVSFYLDSCERGLIIVIIIVDI